jgi:hypothetical protein
VAPSTSALLVAASQRMGVRALDPGDETVISPYDSRQTVLVLVAGLAFIGGLIHIGAAADHWSQSHLYAAAFAVLTALQTAWAILIVRGCSTRVLLAGCALQLGVVVVWALSRTTGVPLAPAAWTPERVGVADLIETIGEVATVAAVMSVLLASRSGFAAAARQWMPGLLLLAIVVSALFGTGAHAG